MAKITYEYETKYNAGDVVIFKNNDRLEVGIIEGYWYDCYTFWYNVRISSQMVYTYSNKGDIAEYDIVGKLEDILMVDCRNTIMGLN